MLSSTVLGTLGFMAPEMLGFDAGGQQLSKLAEGQAAGMWAAGETISRTLTGRASFGDDLNLLTQYIISHIGFPRHILWQAGVSSEGADFVQHCMAPTPSSRPSAAYALPTLGWLHDSLNAYEGLTAESLYILTYNGKEVPFILFTTDKEKLVVITAHRIYLWDVGSNQVIRNWASNDEEEQDWEVSQGSISPDGCLLCVTQADSRRPARAVQRPDIGALA